ncbi:MarR family winged helix-turn-helix transcriptional regulator [Pseudonocardia sp. GCM10023141]|uniref:MarR family winged helix-turn-helix transcriptional regulator n=1 Tax=Pseudonocardia sp. GCM10023141 TaxID=3252653 RepID=UPI00360AA07E
MSTTPGTVSERLMPAIGTLRRLLRRQAGPGFGDAVSTSQREVMLAVARRPGSPVADVAHELGLAPNSVSTMVTQLVASGLLIREPDQQDRRVGRLSLSPDAAAQAAVVRGRRQVLLQKALQGLAPQQIDDLVAGIDALEALAGALRALEQEEQR